MSATRPALKTPDAYYRDLVLSMRNGVLTIQRDGTVAVMNDVAHGVLGVASEPDPIGRHFAEVLGPDHEFSHVLATAFDRGHLPSRAELRLGRSDKVIGYTLSHIADESDAVTGAALFFKDLTRVEQLEERERLRDRLAALGEMAAAIAHEVKNPLASIQVMAGLLKRQTQASDDDQSILNDIIQEAQTANKIVVELLEFVRPINLQLDRLALGTVLRDAIDRHEAQLPKHDVVVDVRVADTLPDVQGDHTQLRQLFMNLLTNAFEALDGRGRVTIDASFLPGDDDAAGASEPADRAGSIVVEVGDDGPGIPPDVTERIFSPFFTTKPRGSGLGLAIVRKVVDAHDGRIDVRARPGGGTLFQVTLPVARDGLGTAPAVRGGADRPGGSPQT